MTTIISVCNMSKRYRQVQAVDNITFAIQQGECCGLLGPNGAGKTTTMEVIEGIHSADCGEILYHNKPINASFADEIGILFQHTSLMDFQTTAEVLQMFQAFYPRTLPINDLIAQCNLTDCVQRYATQLSGGQKQRLLLALALVNDPKILFLDEPTTGLDPQSRRHFWQLIAEIKKTGKTIVLTTHYMEEAATLCDRLLIMDAGHIIASGAPHQLLVNHFGDEARQRNLEDLFLTLTGHGLRE